MTYKIEKKYSENFYYWSFTSDFVIAKVYYWFFENKFSLEEFYVLEKRKGHGKKAFNFILYFLKKEGVLSFFVSSRNTLEAQSFWKKLTGHNYNSNEFDYEIFTQETIKALSVIDNGDKNS